MFQLSKEEFENWKSQFATSNEDDFSRSQIVTSNPKDINMSSQIARTSPKKRPLSALPYAFTENGIAMLSSVLRSPIEVEPFDRSHDRFLCIDDTVYHIGASLKDLGKKWFAFAKMELTTDDLLTKI